MIRWAQPDKHTLRSEHYEICKYERRDGGFRYGLCRRIWGKGTEGQRCVVKLGVIGGFDTSAEAKAAAERDGNGGGGC